MKYKIIPRRIVMCIVLTTGCIGMGVAQNEDRQLALDNCHYYTELAGQVKDEAKEKAI